MRAELEALGPATESGRDAAASSSQSRCPQPLELSAFSRGAMPLAALKSIAEHVSVCPQCESKVSTLVSELAKRATEKNRPAAPGHTSGTVLDSGNMLLEGARIDRSAEVALNGSIEAPTAPLRLGQYRLVRQLGRGGMGVVYQAVHERLHREVAIKFVPVATVKDLLDVDRLQREMTAVGSMRHPNVVYATDAGESEGIHYLVMEYVDGIDLSKLVHRLGPLPVAEACEIVRQAALGLAHVDEQQLVHRDLKPSNLMLSASGTVKILDLGLARIEFGALSDEEPAAHDMTQRGYLLGTIDYVSPEQARHASEVDIRSDIYSLGCTFYKLLAGQPPFGSLQQSSVAAKILAHEHMPPPPLAEYRAGVPEEVELVLGRMLAKNPDDRFQTPHELCAALAPPAEGANLRQLAVDALALEGREPPDAEGTPVGSRTEVEARPAAATAPQLTAAKSANRSWRMAAAVGLCLISGVIVLGVIGGREPKHIPKANELNYPGRIAKTKNFVKVPRRGALTLEAETVQLVNLGELKRGPGRKRFAVTIDQVHWFGEVGIFWGYKVNDGKAEFHRLLINNVGPTFDGKTEKYVPPSYLHVQRDYMYLQPDHGTNKVPEPVSMSQGEILSHHFPHPAPGQKLRFELEFEGMVLDRVVVNDIVLSELTNEAAQARFAPFPPEGPLGLFLFGPIGAGTFSDFDLTALNLE